jgi:hypothetical protein
MTNNIGEYIYKNCPQCGENRQVVVYNHFQWVCPDCKFVGRLDLDFELDPHNEETARKIFENIIETHNSLLEKYPNYEDDKNWAFICSLLGFTGFFLGAPEHIKYQLIMSLDQWIESAATYKRKDDARGN